MEVITDLKHSEWSATLAKLPGPCRDIYFSPEYHRLHEANGDGEALGRWSAVGTGPCWFPASACRSRPRRGRLRQAALGPPDLQRLRRTAGESGRHAGLPRAGVGPLAGRVLPRGDRGGLLPLAPARTQRMFSAGGCHSVAGSADRVPGFFPGMENLWKGAKSQYRNMVNKGRRETVAVQWNEPRAWQAFEALYGRAMHHVEAPAALRFSHGYFMALRLLPGTELCSVQVQGRLAAVSVFLFGPLWCHYHLAVRDPGAGNHLHSVILQSAIERATSAAARNAPGRRPHYRPRRRPVALQNEHRRADHRVQGGPGHRRPGEVSDALPCLAKHNRSSAVVAFGIPTAQNGPWDKLSYSR